MVLGHINRNVRSTTGSNLRKILPELGKDDISKFLEVICWMLNYEKRKVSFLTELLDLRDNTLEVEEFTEDEISIY